MLNRAIPALLVTFVVAAPAAVTAAPRATLILRNGDRIRCELIDLGSAGYTYRIGGALRTLPAGEIALIDLAGVAIPRPEIRRMQEGRPFIALRTGDLIAGRLIDIGGDSPKRLTVRTPDGNEDFSSTDVARIFLAPWEGMPAPPDPAGGRARKQPKLEQGGPGRPVPARQCWTDMRVYVEQGQLVSFTGSGEIQLSDDPRDVATVAGSKTGRYAPGAPIPGVLAGALIGRVDQGAPFGIGDQGQALAMPASGDLWLGINDDHCPDNRGEFRVQIDARRR